MKQDNVTLIGMPGAGKSTLGVVLAKKLGKRFVDTDLLIQEGTGKLLSELLEEHGVDGFIDIENKILRGLECENHVIATGGSAVYGEDAMRHFREIGIVVFIDIDPAELHTRLHTDLNERGVVIHEGGTLEDLYDERHPLYLRYADVRMNTSGLSTQEAVEMLYETVRKALLWRT